MSLTLEAKDVESPPGPRPATVASAARVDAGAEPSTRLFVADTANQPDLLARSVRAAFLADVVTSPEVETPLCLGIVGRAGSGKSTFLNAIVDRIEGQGGPEQGAVGPIVVRVQANPGVMPGDAIAQALLHAVGRTDAALARQARGAGSDPAVVAREVGDRLHEIRSRLDDERRVLDDLTARRGKLADTVLFDTGGSRVDAFARSNRSRIERNLRRFGFEGEALGTYKQLVRDASEPGGALTPGAGSLRVFWAYRGQVRLIVTALLLFAIAWGLGRVLDNQADLVNGLRGLGEKAAPFADWADAHAHWIDPIRTVLVVGGLAAIGLNVVRGLRFRQPIIKGVGLLRSDIEGRARELDARLAQQTKRVDALVADAELASRHMAEAEARLTADPDASRGYSGDTDSGRDGTARTDAMLAAMQAGLFRASAAGERQSFPGRRIVVAIDGFDRLTATDAAAFVRAAADVLNRPGFVTIVAAEREHLASGLAETDPALAYALLDRLIQVPYNLDAIAESGVERDFAAALLDPTIPSSRDDAPAAIPHLSSRSWQPFERSLVETLAPLAGQTPRAVKRFVNLYRIARLDPGMATATPQDLGMLAMVLTGQTSGLFGPINPTFANRLADDEAIAETRRLTSEALGASLDLQSASAGLQTARLYDAR